MSSGCRHLARFPLRKRKSPGGSRGLGVYQATRARQARAVSEQSIEVNCIGQGFRTGKMRGLVVRDPLTSAWRSVVDAEDPFAP
jgi:hypothetical protein